MLSICCVTILLKAVFFCNFWRLKILVLWLKIVENLLVFVYLFCSKSCASDFTKTFITQEWLVIESFPTPRWIAIFNTLSIGQHTLSFQLTNFGLKCLGATWALVTLNAPILSKSKVMNIGGGVCFGKAPG